jgi:hypothetical protein
LSNCDTNDSAPARYARADASQRAASETGP